MSSITNFLLFALSLLAPSSASADMGPEFRVSYHSWCAKNLVLESRGREEPVQKFNCEDTGMVCDHEERYLNRGWVVYAYCRAKR